MPYSLSHIAGIIEAEASISKDQLIHHLLLDSRKLHDTEHSLFFALEGPRRDGHFFIAELYRKGLRNFVVSEKADTSLYPGANFLEVYDTTVALQQLATHHRGQFGLPVIGITGSNGKTIVKEWLYHLLRDDFEIVRSPKSFNSQLGVPLSVWQINEKHTLGLFEAGISEQGEMIRLERIIQPTIGVLTNIGEAHSEGFIDLDHKFREKMTLFRNCRCLIIREADLENRKDVLDILREDIKIISWGSSEQAILRIQSIQKSRVSASIGFDSPVGPFSVTVPFTDDASIENAITCTGVMLELGTPPELISSRMQQLVPVNMRLELKKGINHCLIINDSYSADLSSLEIALGFLDQQGQGTKKSVILSDLLQTSVPDEELYPYILSRLKQHKINRIIGIGEKISNYLVSPGDGTEIESFTSTDEFIKRFRASQFKEETILVKGARIFEFEQIVKLLEEKLHQTLLEINLNAIAHNLKQYQQLLHPATKVMAMVKAFGYGSGGTEIAGMLQYQKVDYLGVAYSDEGVELRKAGISLPVMVMNPEVSSFEPLTSYNLEPELFSFEMLSLFDHFLQQEGFENYPVHIEIETGMNRLGFPVTAINELAERLKSTRSFKVVSVFSHLAASEDPLQDEFTLLQFNRFEKASRELKEALGYGFLSHIANSAAIERHPAMQMDMVRLGIGLYGIDSTGKGMLNLHTVTTLKSTVAQLKKLEPGESVSYNRKGIVQRPSLIATVRIGYADGYPRRLGNGIGKMIIKGHAAPVIGTICMDMTMVDVTDIPGVREGDEVIIFGRDLPVEKLAESAGTISYEIMTGISQRVKRVYYQE